ncbi:DNA-binding transcriptional LysR family regulator [Bradyrhizobium sp. USDA 4503]
MELTDLLTFSTVARLGGITRAADELNTVQSNVTQRIKALEAEIGTALFERHSRGMSLTGAGRRLLPYAQRMAALSREAVLAARDDGEPKGPLSIGSMETTAAVRLPTLLAEFHRRYPAVRLTLRTAPTADLVAAVLDGSLDGAFVAGPIEHAELIATSAFTEELVLVTAQRWKSLAALRAGTPESGPTALVFRTGCTYRQRLEQVFTEFGWPSGRALRVGHARRHGRLRRRRYGRDAVAARRRRARPRPARHPYPQARATARACRDAVHPAPHRASVQRATGTGRVPSRRRSGDRRLTGFFAWTPRQCRALPRRAGAC